MTFCVRKKDVPGLLTHFKEMTHLSFLVFSSQNQIHWAPHLGTGMLAQSGKYVIFLLRVDNTVGKVRKVKNLQHTKCCTQAVPGNSYTTLWGSWSLQSSIDCHGPHGWEMMDPTVPTQDYLTSGPITLQPGNLHRTGPGQDMSTWQIRAPTSSH